ncbi:putative reverse transcriptase zinc-binding domain-containing protein [Helianthus annuus]|nr:putative reverse transcriptase zinc-binding domain-containing protein [Helianthus annuus]
MLSQTFHGFSRYMNRISSWRPVVQVFEDRLSRWKASILSMGGRVTLIKSVLGSLPNYFFSLYKAPVGILYKLESMIRTFLWGGSGNIKKLSWVSWDRVASPISCGGLGIRSLESINRSLLLKWAWRFKTEKESLWVKVISAIHNDRRSWDLIPVVTSLGGVWNNIAKVVACPIVENNKMRNFMRGKVGDGSGLSFWLDPWLDSKALKDVYPNLFRLEKKKRCSVRDRFVRPFQNPEARWEWMKPPDSNVELAEWLDLNLKIREITLSDQRDRWMWLGDETGVFSVGSVKRLFDSNNDFSSRFVWEWVKWVPLKCNLFAWRAELERLPTKVELRNRNIPLQDDICPLCNSERESALHLFTSCQFVSIVWMKIFRWCKVPDMFAFSVRDILEFHRFCGLNGWPLVAFKGIVIITCWQVWKTRNDLVFSNVSRKIEEVVSAIKSIGFLWFKNRSKFKEVSWIEWCKFV